MVIKTEQASIYILTLDKPVKELDGYLLLLYKLGRVSNLFRTELRLQPLITLTLKIS